MSISRFLGLCLVSFAVLALTACASSPEGGHSNKYRIKFDGKAKADSELVFLVTPAKGEPKEVRTMIMKDTKENAAAKQVEKSFKQTLGGKDYSIERDDWEDVLVKKDLTSNNFRIEMTSPPIKGLSVKVKKE
jgi:hypothetical protein